MRIILKPGGLLITVLAISVLVGIVIFDKMTPAKSVAPASVASPKPGKIASDTASESVDPLPTAERTPATWSYTIEHPEEDWMKPNFNADGKKPGWQNGISGFGNDQRGPIHTSWKSPDIWMRREFTLPANWHGEHALRVFHDENAEIYINGVLAATLSADSPSYVSVPMTDAGYKALKPGEKNVIAVHCHNAVGGQFIDVGL